MNDIQMKKEKIELQKYEVEFIQRMLKNLSAGAENLGEDCKITGEVMQVQIKSIKEILNLGIILSNQGIDTN